MAEIELNAKIDTNIGKVAKDQKEWNKEIRKTKQEIEKVNEEGKEVIAEMQILGISINGLKAGWRSAAAGAKFMFRSIKTGIASTGVGLFVLAFGTLATWFAKTKRGAEVLEVVFKGVGAAINVITDRIAKFGGGLFKILSGDVRDGLKDMGESFKDIGKEIQTDTLYTMVLTKQVQKLTDSQRNLNVETAQRRADIEELKLIAEDVTKSEEVRLKAAQDAFKIENDLLERRIKNGEEAVKLEQKRQSTLLDPQKEDLDILAQLEIDLANIRGESTTKQIELNNKINAILAEGTAKRLADLEEQKKIDNEKMGSLTKIGRTEVETFDKVVDKKLAKQKEFTDQVQKDIQHEKDLRAEAAAFQTELNMKAFNALGAHLAANVQVIDNNYAKEKRLAEKNGEDTTSIDRKYEAKRERAAAAAKRFKVAEALITTYQMASLAYKDGLETGGPAGLVLGPLAAGVALAAGLANVKQILSQDVGAGGGGGGGGVTSDAPAPEFLSGSFNLNQPGVGGDTDPMRAYVVTDDMTNSQDKLALIRRRSTI